MTHISTTLFDNRTWKPALHVTWLTHFAALIGSGLAEKTMRRVVTMMALLAAGPSALADDPFTNRPAFSPAEVPAQSSARCDELRAMAEGVPDGRDRIDLSVTGKLTLVKTDGTLWYLVACSDLRVMCVTYEANDMKAGDTVEIRGAYRRLDRDHVVLDPCLETAEAE